MTSVLSRSQLIARMDRDECAEELHQMIRDIEAGDLLPDELAALCVVTQDERRTLGFVHKLPPAVVLTGLRAMQRELQQIGAKA